MIKIHVMAGDWLRIAVNEFTAAVWSFDVERCRASEQKYIITLFAWKAPQLMECGYVALVPCELESWRIIQNLNKTPTGRVKKELPCDYVDRLCICTERDTGPEYVWYCSNRACSRPTPPLMPPPPPHRDRLRPADRRPRRRTRHDRTSLTLSSVPSIGALPSYCHCPFRLEKNNWVTKWWSDN